MISEIKTDLAGQKDIGNFGIALFSKTPITNVEYGIQHDTLDKEGRVITADTEGRTLISVYAPCSRNDDDDARSRLRKDYDAKLPLYIKRIQAERDTDIYITGDYNVAPTDGD